MDTIFFFIMSECEGKFSECILATDDSMCRTINDRTTIRSNVVFSILLYR